MGKRKKSGLLSAVSTECFHSFSCMSYSSHKLRGTNFVQIPLVTNLW